MWSEVLDTMARDQAWRIRELSGPCFGMDAQRVTSTLKCERAIQWWFGET